MGDAKPTVVVTGISGNLGTRLLPQLSEFNVIGVDIAPPTTSLPLRFERMDIGAEESCRQLFLLVRDSQASAVERIKSFARRTGGFVQSGGVSLDSR